MENVLGRKLQAFRAAKGWSQKQLAEVAKVSQNAVSQWEAGDREPSASNLFALCRALGVSCEEFATAGESPAEPQPRAPRGRPRKEPEPEPTAKKGKKK